jgi:uncharacterized protein (TIGR02145 family)
MMVDGKYADESKTSRAWDQLWVSPYYYYTTAPVATPKADKNNGRGGTDAKDGGRGICPKGWHIPTDLEWAIMLDAVDGDGSEHAFANQAGTGYVGIDAGIKLKSAGTYTGVDPGDGSWRNSQYNGTNDYLFMLLPNGHAQLNVNVFQGRGTRAAVHTSSTNDLYSHIAIWAYDNNPYCARSGNRTWHGMSVRCILDK